MDNQLNFTSIEKVKFHCVRDIPTGMAEYKVCEVITDTGVNVCDESEFFSNEKTVPWRQDNRIIIPYVYKRDNDSITITARHIPTQITKDFVITFDKWELAFEDHFDGTQLNPAIWEHCPPFLRAKGYANYWDSNMTFLDGNSHLISRACPGKKTVINEDGTTQEVDAYLSGAIWSKNIFEHKYGYYEVCAKLHHKTGIWGAFWLVAGDMSYDENCPDDNSAVGGAEIDVFESLYNYHTVNSTVHWDGWCGKTKTRGYFDPNIDIDVYDGQFHKFAFRWSPDEYIFLIDGYVTYRFSTGGICKEPGYMNITTECGTWAGDWELKDGEYSDMIIDYVRIYKTSSDDETDK